MVYNINKYIKGNRNLTNNIKQLYCTFNKKNHLLGTVVLFLQGGMKFPTI